MTFQLAQLDEIEVIDDGRCPFRPVRHHLGIQAFGVNSWTGRETGDRIINEHNEDEANGEEELYVVTVGHATFELDGDRVDAPAGTLVFCDTGVKRTAFAEVAGTTILAFGAQKGEAYQVFGWETWAPANRFYEAGDYEGAIAAAKPAIEAHPEYAGPLYNLACVESLAGHGDDAIGHLRQAVEQAPQFRDMAREDADFDPIRDDPRFAELVGG
jgi:tetratricopeptide (TPR) repeat protein